MLRVYCPNIYTVAHTLISGMGELGQTYLRMCLRNLWMVPYDLATTGALRIHIYSWQIVWAIFPGNNTGNIQQFFPGSLGKRFLRGSIAGSTVSRSASRHYIFWISLKNCMNCTWLVYHQTQSDPSYTTEWTFRDKTRNYVLLVCVHSPHSARWIGAPIQHLYLKFLLRCQPSLNTQSCIKGLLVVRDFCFWAV